VLRDTGIFLIGALGAFGDFTAGSTSGMGGSLAVILSRRSSGSIPLRVLIITAKKSKRKQVLYNPKREKSKHNKIIEYTEHLRCHEVEQF
jgi:hypothetical protein